MESKHAIDFYTRHHLRSVKLRQDKRVDKLAGKSARRTLRELIHILEIATTKISILGEFTGTNKRNWLLYILQ